jgi:16S rRNA pseudouridine516 synthase
MKMRIDKFISVNLNLTRNEARKEIKNECVKLNDELCTKNETIIDPDNDKIYYKGEQLFYNKNFYILLNKPKNYVFAKKDSLHQTVFDLLASVSLEDNSKLFNRLSECSIVGRLDIDTTGLVIITNDGKLIHRLTNPKTNIYKTYRVKTDFSITNEDMKKLKEGVNIHLDNGLLYKTKQANVYKCEDNKEIIISICEGKYHQIKKMMKAINKTVLELERIAISNLKLNDLKLADFKLLTKEELSLLDIPYTDV